MREDSDNVTIGDEAVTAISVSDLIEPAKHFNHPYEVLAAEHIDKNEKRAILASWASDQFAVESMPILRHYPGTERAVSYEEILNALKALDEDLQSPHDPASSLLVSSRPRFEESVTGFAKKLNVPKLWKGECAATTADA